MTGAAGQKSNTAGFTLLEMTIVLAIMGAVSTGLVMALSAQLQRTQYRQTMAKMQAIETALVNYRIGFNRLPCPADATIGVSALLFGMEALNPGTCTGGAPAANYSLAPVVGTQDAREGMVPIKTLGLPDDYAFDGWGRRFMYAVSKDFTQSGAFSVISAYDTLPRMTILNEQGTTISTQAGQVLISFGPNGHGAFTRNGGATRLNASSVNVDELNNCDCNSSGVSTGFDGTFIQKESQNDTSNVLNGFDDIVFFAGRGNYLLPTSLIQQPFNFSATGPTGCAGGPPICSVNLGVKTCMCGY